MATAVPSVVAASRGDEINILAIVKLDGEKYVFLFRNEEIELLLNIAGRFADDPGLSFTWRDAATVADRARKLANP